jgi:hypothetical protein
MKKLTWTFIVLVAVTDVAFSWQRRASAPEWEANPVASQVLQSTGFAGVVVYRAAWLGYAGVMARVKTRMSWLITPVWGAGHLYLLVLLLEAFHYAA